MIERIGVGQGKVMNGTDVDRRGGHRDQMCSCLSVLSVLSDVVGFELIRSRIRRLASPHGWVK